MERPVVATSQGAEGLTVTSGENILIGDTPEAFAEHVCTLITKPRFGDRLGREGRRLAEKTYDWSLCFQNLDALYESLTHVPALRAVDRREAIAQ
jgi:glycosyltransferase involved in cell wall biosynthesis